MSLAFLLRCFTRVSRVGNDDIGDICSERFDAMMKKVLSDREMILRLLKAPLPVPDPIPGEKWKKEVHFESK